MRVGGGLGRGGQRGENWDSCNKQEYKEKEKYRKRKISFLTLELEQV